MISRIANSYCGVIKINANEVLKHFIESSLCANSHKKLCTWLWDTGHWSRYIAKVFLVVISRECNQIKRENKLNKRTLWVNMQWMHIFTFGPSNAEAPHIQHYSFFISLYQQFTWIWRHMSEVLPWHDWDFVQKKVYFFFSFHF